MNASYALNEEHQGIEVKFDGKPSEEIRDNLKRFKFRWSRRQKLWYAKQRVKSMSEAWHESRMGYVHSITSTEPVAKPKVATANDFGEKIAFIHVGGNGVAKQAPKPSASESILAILAKRAERLS